MIDRVFHFSLQVFVVDRVVVLAVLMLTHVHDLLGVSGGGLRVVSQMLLAGEGTIQAGRRTISSGHLLLIVRHRRADDMEQLLLRQRRLLRKLSDLSFQPEMARRVVSDGVLYLSSLSLTFVLPFIQLAWELRQQLGRVNWSS